MATIEETLAAMSDEVTVTDEILVIDPSTRQINLPGSELIFGVEGDGGSERKYFQCPRYVGDNVDLASSFLRVNFRNANGDTDEYLVEDVALDGDNVTFSWVLSPKAVKYKGQTKFVVCVIGPDLKLAWHTTLATGIVLAGLEPDNSHVESETADVVAQLIAMVEAQTTAVENTGAEWVRNVQNEGTDQVIAVQTAAKTAETASVAEIEAKGVNTLESIPADYTALSEAVDTLTRTRGAAIVCEVEGSVVAVNDASDLPMQGLRVFGKTTQAKTTGKNLLVQTATSQTVKNVKFTVNADGSITASGAADSDIYFDIGNITATGDFVLSGCPANGGNTKYFLDLVITGVSSAGEEYGNGKSVNLVGEKYTCRIRIKSGVTVSNLTFYPMVRLASVADATYEPYTGGKASPSPEYPQELASLEPVVNVCGKNLFDGKLEIGAINANSGAMYYLETESRTVNYIPVIPGVPIYIKREDAEGAIKPRFYDRKFNYLGTGTGNLKLNSGYSEANPMNDGTTECCITITNEAIAYMKICVASVNLENCYMVSMIDAEYEESPGNQTVPLTHTLPGIPVTSGGNYTDENGKQWICDEVDFERGVYVKRIGKTVFDENQVYHINNYRLSDGGHYVFGCSLSNLAVSDAPVMSDQYRHVQWDKWNLATATHDIVCYTGVAFFFFLAEQKIQTIEAFTEYMGTHPAIVQYILTAPIETPLSETEIAAYRALHTNKPNTTILNDAGAHMAVAYAADTKLYIDNKIKEALQ